MSETILGLNAFHGDSAACLVVGGKLVAATEEERFRRLKHWAGFPSQAAESCLSAAGMTLADVDHVAVNPDPSADLLVTWSTTPPRPEPPLSAPLCLVGPRRSGLRVR